MDLSKIKQFVKQNGDKFIFMENGEPEIVMMSFDEYEKLACKSFVEGAILKNDGMSSKSHDHDMPDSDEGMFQETEFIAPAEREIPRSASSPLGRGDMTRMGDIRLEDLPI